MSKTNEKFHTMLNDIRKDMNDNHLEVVVSIARIEEGMKNFEEKIHNNELDNRQNKKDIEELKTSNSLTKQKVASIATVLGLAGGVVIAIVKSFLGV